jgi:hypothetical protein
LIAAAGSAFSVFRRRAAKPRQTRPIGCRDVLVYCRDAIPLHRELRAIINATPTGRSTLLVTNYGKPFSPNGFGGSSGLVPPRRTATLLGTQIAQGHSGAAR